MDQREFKKRLGDLAAGRITHDDLLSDLKQQEPKQQAKPDRVPPRAIGRKPAPPEINRLFDEPAASQIAPGDIKKLRAAFSDAKQSLARFEAMLEKLIGPE
ncbi:MAG: hypothetical protein ACR2I2_22475 [Bryobacteraceae bacterium]